MATTNQVIAWRCRSLISGTWVILVLALLFPVAVAETIVAEGVASIRGDRVEQARRDAIEDALWYASAQLGLSVQTETLLANARILSDETTVSTDTLVSDFEILEEWRVEHTYHVRIRINAARALCGVEYPMQIGAVAFPLLRPQQQRAPGLYGLEMGVPNEILHRLSLYPHIAPHRTEIRHLFELQPSLPTPRSPAIRRRVQEIALDMEVDYVLAGVIVDIGWENVGFLVNRYQRQAEVEVYLFAGDTGELLLQRRAGREASGRVVFDSRVFFGSQQFTQSDYGQAFAWVLDQLAGELQRFLQCPPQPTWARR